MSDQAPIESGVTGAGMSKIQAWTRARAYRDRQLATYVKSVDELNRAAQELGNWMAPDDAKRDETFHLWVGDGLLRVDVFEHEGVLTYKVEWRTPPSARAACEMHL